MHLLNVKTKLLESFDSEIVPKYAILSHTWGSGEVLFADMQGNLSRAEQKEGFAKVIRSCKQAELDGLAYIWIDSCCIDKSSSAELSESINSMFLWYQEAELCYAFLSDFAHDRPFSPANRSDWSRLKQCRWFGRGWTLQELLAPKRVLLFGDDWRAIGEREELTEALEYATGIPANILNRTEDLHSASVAQRMSWASSRKTTKIEDEAYSLLGIFGVSLPFLYGEGRKAFLRLQEEILRETEDQSLFAWVEPARSSPVDTNVYHGIFADSPSQFAECGQIVAFTDWQNIAVSYVSSSRVSLRLPLIPLFQDVFKARISCRRMSDLESNEMLGIYLKKIHGPSDRYTRLLGYELASVSPDDSFEYQTTHIPQKPVMPKKGDINLVTSYVIEEVKFDGQQFHLVGIFNGSPELRTPSSVVGTHVDLGPRPISLSAFKLYTVAVFLDLQASRYKGPADSSVIFLLLGSTHFFGGMTTVTVDDVHVARLVYGPNRDERQWPACFEELERLYVIYAQDGEFKGTMQDTTSYHNCKFDLKTATTAVQLGIVRETPPVSYKRYEMAK